MQKLIFLFSLLFIFPGIAHGEEEVDRIFLKHFEIQEREEITVRFESLSVDENVHVAQFWSYAEKFLSKSDFKNNSTCKEIKLDVYLIDDDEINNREVLSFLDWESWDNKDIWGAYYRSNSKNERVVFINISATEKVFGLTVFHEMYHWYQDITCTKLSERDALDFSNKMCQAEDLC